MEAGNLCYEPPWLGGASARIHHAEPPHYAAVPMLDGQREVIRNDGSCRKDWG